MPSFNIVDELPFVNYIFNDRGKLINLSEEGLSSTGLSHRGSKYWSKTKDEGICYNSQGEITPLCKTRVVFCIRDLVSLVFDIKIL